MPELKKSADPQPVNNYEKTTMILVIIFGSISVLLLGYVAMRVTFVQRQLPARPGVQNQLQQRRLQRGSTQPQNQSPTGADPLNFNEEMNTN